MNITEHSEVMKYISVDTLGDIRVNESGAVVERVNKPYEWNPFDITAYMDIDNDDAIVATQDNIDFLYALIEMMEDHLDAQRKDKKPVKKKK